MMVTGHKQGYTSDCGLGPIQKLEQINIETVELQSDLDSAHVSEAYVSTGTI